MKTIRSFIAMPLADEVRRSVIRLIERLRQPGDGIKWVPVDNLHLTLKFLGEVENVEVPRVCQVVEDVCQDIDPFDLSLAGTDAFPDIDRPRILYVAIQDPTESLTTIVTRLDRELAELGFKREPRDYVPHLTLGRSRSGSRKANLDVIERLEQERETEFGTMQAEAVQTIASFLDKGGPTYQVMDTVWL